MSWSGNDGFGSGVASYDVQYRFGSGGSWVTWLGVTTDMSALFGPTSPMTVEDGETYYFQVRARDIAGNVEAYPGGDGDTSTTVELSDVYLPLVVKSY